MNHRQPACADDPEAMYGTREAEIAYARYVCSGCSVQMECLQIAIDLRDRWGVWGGKTPEERSAMIRARSGQQPHIRRDLVAHVAAGTDPIHVLNTPEQAWLYQQHVAAGSSPNAFAARYRLSGRALIRIQAQSDAQTPQTNGQLALAA